MLRCAAMPSTVSWRNLCPVPEEHCKSALQRFSTGELVFLSFCLPRNVVSIFIPHRGDWAGSGRAHLLSVAWGFADGRSILLLG